MGRQIGKHSGKGKKVFCTNQRRERKKKLKVEVGKRKVKKKFDKE
jgi:hypothetical protein